MRTDKIFFVGFMGAGKSTVAAALGAHLGWRVEDLDDRIEAREGHSVADIFARHGEQRFRAAEQAVLQDILPVRHVVVATGGGTFVDPMNRMVINRSGASIWLDVSFDTVIARLPTDGRRPLAKNHTSMQSLFNTRRTAYQHAHLRLDANRAPAAELVERIVDWLGA